MIQIVSVDMASRDFIAEGGEKKFDNFLFVCDVFEW